LVAQAREGPVEENTGNETCDVYGDCDEQQVQLDSGPVNHYTGYSRLFDIDIPPGVQVFGVFTIVFLRISRRGPFGSDEKVI
jgi:hypothetical protein